MLTRLTSKKLGRRNLNNKCKHKSASKVEERVYKLACQQLSRDGEIVTNNDYLFHLFECDIVSRQKLTVNPAFPVVECTKEDGNALNNKTINIEVNKIGI